MKNTKKLFSIAFGSLFREKLLLQMSSASDKLMAAGKARREAKLEKDKQATEVARAEEQERLEKKAMGESATYRSTASALDTTKQSIDEGLRKDLADSMQGLDEWKINIVRRSKNMNADKWDPSTEEGWAVVKKDWVTLGLWKDNDFFQNIEKEMKKSHKAKKNVSAIDDVSMMLRSPRLYTQNQIVNLDGQFAKAYGYFKEVQTLVKTQTSLQTAGEKARQDKNSEPFLEEAGRIVKSNVNEFKNAIKRRDYATAGLYVVGIWAAWNAVSSLPDDETSFFSKSKMKKWFFWGATAYAGNYMAKKAGYDIMEKLGFKESWESVKGTPIEYFRNFYIPGQKPVDLRVTQALSKTNIGSISEQFHKTNGAVAEWIDPNQFSVAFADKNFSGLRANDLKKTTPLSTEEKEYLRVGQEIYASYKVMQYAYDKTMKDHAGTSFEEAITRDPVLKNSTVEDFASALFRYVPEDLGDNVLQTGAGEKLREKMHPLFKDSGMGLIIETAERDPGKGVFAARMMDYPVIIRINSKTNSYDIFRRNQYEDLRRLPNSRFAIASIPMEGEADGSLTIIENKITSIMKAHMDTFKQDYTVEPVRYERGEWKVRIKSDEHPHLRGEINPVDATVRMGNLGRSLRLYKPDGGLLVHLNNVSNVDEIHGSTVLAKLSVQRASEGFPDLSLFQYFNTAGLLTYIPAPDKSRDFSVRISSMSEEIQFEFDEAANKYRFKNHNTEKELLGDYKFTRHLQDAMRKNAQLTDLRRDFTALIDGTNEDYFFNFLKNVPGWFSDFTIYYPGRGIRLEHLTGSVSKNYFSGLLDSKMDYLGARAAGALEGATSFDAVAGEVSTTYQSGIMQMRELKSKFAKHINANAAEGKDFTEVSFAEEIMGDLMKVGIKSTDYQNWYRSFVDQIHLGYGRDDLREQGAIDANRLVSTFAWYTRVLDKPELDGVNAFYPYDDKEFFETMTKVEDVIAKFKKTEKTPTDKDILDRIPSINDGSYSVDDYKGALKGQEQGKRRKYANHVAGRIKDQMLIFKGNIPEPGAHAWGIEKYENFKFEMYSDIPEVIAETGPRMKTIHDGYYIPFDEYLKDKAKYEKDPKWRDKLIIPRHTVDLPPMTKEELDLFIDVAGARDSLAASKMIKGVLDPFGDIDTPPTPNIPQLEQYISEQFRWSLSKLKVEYPDTTEKFDKLLAVSSLPSYEIIKKGEGSNISGEKLTQVEFSCDKSNAFRTITKMVLKDLNISRKGRVDITPSMQKKIVAKYIMEWVDDNILGSPADFDLYFKNTSWTADKIDAIKASWHLLTRNY